VSAEAGKRIDRQLSSSLAGVLLFTEGGKSNAAPNAALLLTASHPLLM
jgi:hypothetical protein